MSRHKNKLILLVSGLLMLSIFVSFSGTSTAPNNPQQPETAATEPTANQEVTEPTVRQTSTQTNLPKPQKIDSTKHNSELLASNPSAIEYEYFLMATTNDPQLGSSWHLSKIQTDRAWDVTVGDEEAVVAVIDSPFALTHEDLTGKWHTNSGETGNTQNGDACWDGSAKDKSTNNCDDDENGYIDDWRGYDFINDDNNVAGS